jgi:hypothetical protein
MYAVAEPELPGEFESNAADSRLIAGGFEVFDDSAAVAAGEQRADFVFEAEALPKVQKVQRSGRARGNRGPRGVADYRTLNAAQVHDTPAIARGPEWPILRGMRGKEKPFMNDDCVAHGFSPPARGPC